MPVDAGSGGRQASGRVQAGRQRICSRTVLYRIRRLPLVSTFAMTKTQDCIRYLSMAACTMRSIVEHTRIFVSSEEGGDL